MSEEAGTEPGKTCNCCGLRHDSLRCDCTGCDKCQPQQVVRLDERMKREKLESAIAWFSGQAKPSNRRVSRGDLAAMLRDYAALRALVLASRPALETAVEMMTDIAAHGTASERMNGMFLAAQLRTLSAYGVGK
jgi:hypothetical protein